MSSISDFGPLYRLLDVDGKSITLSAISFEDLVPMLDRFEELKQLLTPGRDGELSKTDFSFAGLMKMGPRIVGAIIAASMGNAGDAKTEEWAKKLSMGHQVAAMRDIMEMTFPKGLGAFVDDLRAMGLLGSSEDQEDSPKPQANGTGEHGKVPVGTSQLPSSESPKKSVTMEL